MPDQTQYLLNFSEFEIGKNQNSNYNCFFSFQKMIHIKFKREYEKNNYFIIA